MDSAEGIKNDAGKLPYHLVPWDAMDEVVKVLQAGAKKYAERNWEKGMAWHRLFGAIVRHTTAWFMGEDADPETGLSPLAHAACDCLFLLAYVKRKMVKFDDRPNTQRAPNPGAVIAYGPGEVPYCNCPDCEKYRKARGAA